MSIFGVRQAATREQFYLKAILGWSCFSWWARRWKLYFPWSKLIYWHWKEEAIPSIYCQIICVFIWFLVCVRALHRSKLLSAEHRESTILSSIHRHMVPQPGSLCKTYCILLRFGSTKRNKTFSGGTIVNVFHCTNTNRVYTSGYALTWIMTIITIIIIIIIIIIITA